jgi:membrane protein DedA with SNARE-associated domain
MNIIDLVTNLAVQGKYPLLFIIYLIEGPISGFISAIIATTGQLNIYIIFLLLVTGEIGADLVYYYLGRTFSESKLNKELDKYEKTGVLNVMKETLDKHPVRTLIFVKSVALIAVPSLLLIGKYKALKFPKFLLWTTIVCLVKDITVLFLGYGLGISLETFIHGYDIYRALGIILAIIAICYILFRANREKIEQFIVNTLSGFK